MGKGGGGKGGYPWWEHIKNKGGGKGTVEKEEPATKVARPNDSELSRYLQNLEGQSYGSYKNCVGEWKQCPHTVFVDHVQSDPYAPPSSVRVRISQDVACWPKPDIRDPARNRGCCDFVSRVFYDLLKGGSGTNWTRAPPSTGWGGSKGGDIQIAQCGQFILERSAVILTNDYIEARVTLALPARGRSIEGRRAAGIVSGLVTMCEKALNYSAQDPACLRVHLETLEDEVSCRLQLSELGLVAFVGNGAILPRRSGVDDRPMEKGIAFESPPSMEVSIDLPHRGTVKGMGIKKGVSLIVGGGFHGKSTLLQAIQFGVYDKVPYDGREMVVTDACAAKIRAEDGRSLKCVDISPFINNLPLGQDTTHFSTADASGSTSQAANIMEAMEAGASCLLLDEDTCASNFMIRDARMQALVAREKEPITPFLHKVRSLYADEGVSTIMVVGGAGDFFEVADSVVMMEKYLAKDVTEDAKEISRRFPSVDSLNAPFGKSHIVRKLQHEGLAPNGKASAKSLRCIGYGDEEVELTYVEQLVDVAQARALCDILQFLGGAKSAVDGTQSLKQILDSVERELKGGFDSISWKPAGFYARPRRLEIAAAINRLRSATFTA
eukprot:GEMP01029512.1.p1 GENE.GEMP01029512.1~~GEMP01029512.1.p1  ORF type:complete len:609 (+),score=144.78 GEMP01029512.1:14-1840(+)